MTMRTFSKEVSLAFDDCGEGRGIALTAFLTTHCFLSILYSFLLGFNNSVRFVCLISSCFRHGA